MLGCSGSTNPVDQLLQDSGITAEQETSILYNSTVFTESDANDGSILNSIPVIVSGDEWASSIGTDLISQGQVRVDNLPEGLSASFVISSTTEATVTLLGNALSHADLNDVGNLNFEVLSGTLKNLSNYNQLGNKESPNLSIDFIQRNLLVTYDSSSFTESNENDGRISNPITINLSEGEFSGLNGEDFIALGYASVENLPDGLSPEIIRASSTSLSMRLNGVANSHTSPDNVTDFTVRLNENAFDSVDGIYEVTGAVKSDILISYVNPYSIILSSSQFQESGLNDGSIKSPILMTITGSTVQFVGDNGDDLIAEGHFTTNNVPSGLTASAVRISDYEVAFMLNGNADNHITAASITNVEYTLLDSAFSNGDSSVISGVFRNDISVSFIGAGSLVYSTITVTEDISNVGVVNEQITITLINDIFNGTNGDDYIADSKVSVSGAPAGLVVEATRQSATEVVISFSGSATVHSAGASVSNLSLTFQDDAFLLNDNANQVANYSRSDISIDLIDPYSLSVDNTSMNESVSNDGSVTDTPVFTLSGTQLNAAANDDLIADGKAGVTGLPSGFTAELRVLNSQQAQLTLLGTADDHEDADDTASVDLSFNDNAFVSGEADGVNNADQTLFSIDFNDAPYLTWASTTFSEDTQNIGEISNTINVTLTNDTYAASIGEDLVASGKVTTGNTPNGLTVTADVISNVLVTLSLTGTATSHFNADDIANLSINFANGAFTNGSAARVGTSSQSAMAVDFIDPYEINITSQFITETNPANDGTVTDTIDFDLSGAVTFLGSNGDDFLSTSRAEIQNVPFGLVPQLEKISDTKLRLSFSSAASSHISTDTVGDLSIEIKDSGFSTGESDGVLNAEVGNIGVIFYDSPGTTITLVEGVDGYSGNTHTYLRGDNPTENTSTNDHVRVRSQFDSENNYRLALMKWTIPGSLPPSAKVTDAKMHLYFHQNDGSGTCSLEIRRVLRDWVESEATYNEPSTGQSWEIAGAKGATDIGSEVLGYINTVNSTFQTETAVFTDAGIRAMQDMIDNPATNYGFALVVPVRFFSGCGVRLRGGNVGNAAQRSALEITYVTNIDDKSGWLSVHDLHPVFSLSSKVVKGLGDLNETLLSLSDMEAITAQNYSPFHPIDYDSEVTQNAEIVAQIEAQNDESNGADPTGGDAFDAFNGLVSTADGQFRLSGGDSMNLEFAELNPNRSYRLTAALLTNGSSNAQTSLLLDDAQNFNNTSSSGTTIRTDSVTDDEVVIDGDNQADGHLAEWQGIVPIGTDNSFTLRASEADVSSAGYSYAPAAIILEEHADEILIGVDEIVVSEGATFDIPVRLARQPSGPVTVNLALAESIGENNITDTDVTINGSTTLNFTTANWSTWQNFQLIVAEDDNDVWDRENLAFVAATDYPTRTLPISKMDNDVPNLLGLYEFEGNWDDTSGNGRHATQLGAVVTPFADPTRGQVLKFDTNGQKLQLPAFFQTAISSKMTICFWAYVDAATDVDQMHAIGKTDYGQDIAIRWRASGKFQARFAQSNGSNITIDNLDASTDTWVHFCQAVGDGNSYAYLDGELISNIRTTYDGTIRGQSIDFYIGGAGNNNRTFKGMLDNVRIYDDLLSSEQILQIYTNETP